MQTTVKPECIWIVFIYVPALYLSIWEITIRYFFLCLFQERGVESRPQWDPESLLCEQGGAEGDVREGQAQGTGNHTLVQPHCGDLPLQVVGQPAEPQAVHRSQNHPPHVTTTNQDGAQSFQTFGWNCLTHKHIQLSWPSNVESSATLVKVVVGVGHLHHRQSV